MAAGGHQLPPTTASETDSDKSSVEEKQDRETLGEVGGKKGGVNIVIIEGRAGDEVGEESGVGGGYVERDKLCEEAVLVEPSTITITTTNMVGQSSAATQTSSATPHSPRLAGSRYRPGHGRREKPPRAGRAAVGETAGRTREPTEAELTEVQLVDRDAGLLRRQPRPPVRRRPRSKQVSERPKSAPPDKFDIVLGGRGGGRDQAGSTEAEWSGPGTLESVSGMARTVTVLLHCLHYSQWHQTTNSQSDLRFI